MTDDQRDIIVKLIRNTIDYMHNQEVMLIQLAGSIEMEKENPEPTPAEETAEESRKFFKKLQEADPDYQYPFPWGRKLGKTADEDKPGLTHIVSETQQIRNIAEKPESTPIRDAMVNGPGEPPRGAWE